jgi:hypothetical protein
MQYISERRRILGLETAGVSALVRFVVKIAKSGDSFPGLRMNPAGYINGVYEFINQKRDDD